VIVFLPVDNEYPTVLADQASKFFDSHYSNPEAQHLLYFDTLPDCHVSTGPPNV